MEVQGPEVEYETVGKTIVKFEQVKHHFIMAKAIREKDSEQDALYFVFFPCDHLELTCVIHFCFLHPSIAGAENITQECFSDWCQHEESKIAKSMKHPIHSKDVLVESYINDSNFLSENFSRNLDYKPSLSLLFVHIPFFSLSVSLSVSLCLSLSLSLSPLLLAHLSPATNPPPVNL